MSGATTRPSGTVNSGAETSSLNRTTAADASAFVSAGVVHEAMAEQKGTAVVPHGFFWPESSRGSWWPEAR